MDVTDGNRIPMGYEKIQAAALASAVGLTVPTSITVVPGKVTAARLALIRVITNSVRWRDDGTDPTAANGMPMTPEDGCFPYTGSLAAIKFIAESGSPELHVKYYF